MDERQTEPLTAEEEAKVRLRAGHSIIWGPGTEASDRLVNDRLWQAVQDRRRLIATLDRDRSTLSELRRLHAYRHTDSPLEAD